MAKTLRFALIGCGGMGGGHASNIRNIDGIEIVAWCDIVEQKAKNYLDKFGGKYFTKDAQDILADPEIDGVLIATATGEDYAAMHSELSIDALRAGKHTFCEKPIGSTLAKADELVEVAESVAPDLKFQHGFCLEYSPTIEYAKQLMPNPAYSFFQCAGGVVAQACHNIDLIVHKIHTARLVSVYAAGGTPFGGEQNVPVDSFTAIFKFEDGSSSTYLQHVTFNNALNKFSAQLYGPEGCVFLSDRFQEILHFPTKGEPAKPYRDEKLYMGHVQEIEHLVQCINEGGQPKNTAAMGRLVLAVEKAVCESAVTGKVIDM